MSNLKLNINWTILITNSLVIPNNLIIMIVFLFVFVACLIGLIVERYILLKFFLFYETFFFSISVIMLIYSVDINVMIVVFYLLLNSTFEVILGLSIILISIILSILAVVLLGMEIV